MTDDNRLYDLSRRKVLGGMAIIGAAGAGAGLGTSALFSDEEEFENNSFTAGTLDMEVTGEIVAANDEYIQEVTDITGNPITADGAVEAGFQIQDFKPGDWFILCIEVNSVAENPFYVTLHAEDLLEWEGTSTEPETQDDGDTSDQGWEQVANTNAELGDKLLVSYWEMWGGTDRSDLENLDNITNTETNNFYFGTRGALPNGGDPGEDGLVSGSTPAVGYTDVREFYYGLDQDPANSVSGNNPLGNGFASGDGILVGGVSNTTVVGSDNSTYTNATRRLSDPDEDGEGELVFYLCFELPEEVGNEIQGDQLKGSFRINAEQVRNNDDPRSGRS